MNFFSKKKEPIVLIADDVATIRSIVISVFQKANFKIIEARNGEELLTLAKSYLPDIIVTDVNMPQKSGIEAVEELRQDERFKSTTIIMLTSESDRETLLKAASLGIKDFILKDNLEHVTQQLQKHIEKQ